MDSTGLVFLCFNVTTEQFLPIHRRVLVLNTKLANKESELELQG